MIAWAMVAALRLFVLVDASCYLFDDGWPHPCPMLPIT
jgi:hypothetical protein